MSGDYSDYEFVDARTIHDAVNGDNEAFMRIYQRYRGYVVNLLVTGYGEMGIPPERIPFEDHMNSTWMEMKKCVMKFRPR